MSTASAENSPVAGLAGARVAFCGKLAGMNRREAQRLIREHGGTPVEKIDADVRLLVLGEEGWPLGDAAVALADVSQEVRAAAERGTLEIVTETQLWQRLGLIDGEQHIQRLYTPAMLADLLQTPVAVVRRWHRRGLIKPVREVRRLPYFNFQEVLVARRLAEVLAAGVSPDAIERQLRALGRFVPDVERPLAQLSVIVEGKRLLLRRDGGLLDPQGQRRFDFDAVGDNSAMAEIAPNALLGEATDGDTTPNTADERSVAPGDWASPPDGASLGDLLESAARLEEEGRLEAAVEAYRASLAAGGPRADVCFVLAELLYRLGDPAAARERYYMAIELDEDYVEARANLGCLLAETGQAELAVAAFQGALAFHPEYADAHYHLARVLDELGRTDEATPHWRAFVQLTPDSPWVAAARRRLDGE